MKYPIKAFFGSLLTLVAILAAVWVLDRSERARFRQQSRTEVLARLSTVRARLEEALNRRVFLVRGLGAYISTVNPDIDQKTFKSLTSVIVAHESGIRNIALYNKDTVCTHIYPLKGHEQAIGFSPLYIPQEREAIARAIQQKQTILAGPINFVEGGVGFIARTPIFLTPPGQDPESGSYWGLTGTVIDQNTLFKDAGLQQTNTNLEQAKEELAQAKEQLEAVLNAVPGSISWIDSGGLYIGVNRYVTQIWNLSQDAFIGRQVGFFKGNSQFAEFMRQFLASEETSASSVIEVQVNEQVRYYLVAAQKYQQGTASVSVGIDITERKLAEEALRIAEENYRSIFENALEGIFQSTPDGHISVNPAMARIYGYDSPEEMIATVNQISHRIYVDRGGRDEFQRLMEQQGEATNFDYQVYRKDGSIIWVEEDTRAVRDSNGNLLYYEGLIQDVSERKRSEEHLKRQLQELQIEIDQQHRLSEVAVITQSNYFQEIQAEVENIQIDQFWS